jgi:lysophospholipase L1-like esterase
MAQRPRASLLLLASLTLAGGVCTGRAGRLEPPQTAPVAPPPVQPSTVRPEPRPDQWWQERHAVVLERIRRQPVEVLFIGDSITQGWEGEGRAIWERRFAPRHAVNLGFSGDRTQHVLWRLQNGEIEGIAPDLAVIMIGTNNSNGSDNTAEEIASGIEEIIKTLRERLPKTKVLLLGIFPRGEKPGPQREKNAKASALAAKITDGKAVRYLDIGSVFTEADGTISREVMPDHLHLSALGYQRWADAIEVHVKELAGEAPTSRPKPTGG